MIVTDTLYPFRCIPGRFAIVHERSHEMENFYLIICKFFQNELDSYKGEIGPKF